MKADNENPVQSDVKPDPSRARRGGGRLIARVFGFVIKLALPFVILAGAYQIYTYLKSTKPEVAQRTPSEKVWPVHSLSVQFEDYQPNLRLYGEAISGRRVELRALVAGEVIEAGPKLKEGAEVSKGDVLLRIDPFNYEGALTEAQAGLMEAEAKLKEIEAKILLEKIVLERLEEQLVLAKKDLARAVPLAKKGTVTEKVADDRRLVVSQRHQEVERVQNNLKVQQAKADQQRAAIQRLEWSVRQAKRNLEHTSLKSPFDAYVSKVNAELGRMLGVNDSVATLLDKDWIDIRFSLSDRQFGRVTSGGESVIGRQVEVLWYIGEEPQHFVADIERVSADISSEDGGVEVYARIRDPRKVTPIRVGAFVEIIVPDKRFKQIVRLPQTVLYGGDRIYVIKDERLTERKIQVVGSAGEEILVKGPLTAGERVLTTRLSTAGEGLKVRDLSVDGPAKKDGRKKPAPQAKLLKNGSAAKDGDAALRTWTGQEAVAAGRKGQREQGNERR